MITLWLFTNCYKILYTFGMYKLFSHNNVMLCLVTIKIDYQYFKGTFHAFFKHHAIFPVPRANGTIMFPYVYHVIFWQLQSSYEEELLFD